MKLLAVTPLGRNRESSRLWIETRRLEALGFPPGTPIAVESKTDELILRPAILAENHVSSRKIAGGIRPIIDIANQALLRGLADYPELKITGWFERLQVTPTRRAAAILRSRKLAPPFRVLEVFAGGGTMTAALSGNPNYIVQAGIEIEPRFADVWQAAHPGAALIQADIRAVENSDLPPFDILIGGIPCTSHSTLGRAKKGLAGKPELGDTGDLFIPVLSLIRDRMPAAIVFENVPSFGNSLAEQVYPPQGLPWRIRCICTRPVGLVHSTSFPDRTRGNRRTLRTLCGDEGVFPPIAQTGRRTSECAFRLHTLSHFAKMSLKRIWMHKGKRVFVGA